MLITKYIKDEPEMLSFGGKLADELTYGGIIFLKGDLGAGKTTLVRGLVQHLGYEGIVKSPTYTLVEPYNLNQRTIYHFDLYRLSNPEELEYIGGRDYWENNSLCLIEWPEKAKGYLPEADITIEITYHNSGRLIEITRKQSAIKQ